MNKNNKDIEGVRSRDIVSVMSRADEFDLSFVRERFASKFPGVTNHAKIEREFLRYAVLFSVYKEQSFPMGGIVDEYWHTFLMFTRQYEAFCISVLGRMMHHEPEDHNLMPLADKIRVEEDIATFVSVYKKSFGEWPPLEIWPFSYYTVMHDPT